MQQKKDKEKDMTYCYGVSLKMNDYPDFIREKETKKNDC